MGSNFAELQLSRSAMGNPSDLYVLGHLIDYNAELGDGWRYGITPSGNGPDGTGAFPANYAHWFHYSLESGVSSGDVIHLDTTVPIPAAVWLFGSGLIGIVGIRRKFKN
jgi:hypothetical protein